MRKITSHKVDGVNDGIELRAEIVLGPGGAPHHYEIEMDPVSAHIEPLVDIDFQSGGIKENGINGLTHEVLLAIVIDRLEHFQSGPYPCAENGIALEHTRMALNTLQARTRMRLARGVEGQCKA